MVHEVIIEDEDGDQIEVVEDFGEISPEDQDSEDYENGYENQIIKKALNR